MNANRLFGKFPFNEMMLTKESNTLFNSHTDTAPCWQVKLEGILHISLVCNSNIDMHLTVASCQH